MGFSLTVSYGGGGGMRAPHHNFVVMHQSIPSTNIPPGNFFKVVKFPAPGQKIFAKVRPRGKKIDKNPAPGDNFVDLQDNLAMIVKPFA